MRWYDAPLEQHGRVVEDGAEFVIVRVEQPAVPNGLGHAGPNSPSGGLPTPENQIASSRPGSAAGTGSASHAQQAATSAVLPNPR